jgi:hypothetical protein
MYNKENKIITNNNLIKCYGCGAEVRNFEGPKHAYIGSDAGCWEIFCEVLAKEYTHYNELWQSHRLTVDTYAAQHPGAESRRSAQSVYIHLTRLYLQLEKGVTGKAANDFMKKISAYRNEFRWLEAPDFSGTMNILDIAKAKDMDEHKLLVEKWAKDVWNAWSRHHNEIITFAERVITENKKGK